MIVTLQSCSRRCRRHGRCSATNTYNESPMVVVYSICYTSASAKHKWVWVCPWHVCMYGNVSCLAGKQTRTANIDTLVNWNQPSLVYVEQEIERKREAKKIQQHIKMYESVSWALLQCEFRSSCMSVCMSLCIGRIQRDFRCHCLPDSLL